MHSSRSLLVTLALVAAAVSGCGLPAGPSPNVSESPTGPASNPVAALRVSAGEDVWLPLPVNQVVLRGFATASTSPIATYLWRKLSGPGSCSIESPELWRTAVAQLAEGTYEFEVTVTTQDGYTVRDSVMVHVYDPRGPGLNEFTFRSVSWQCPMGCWTSIDNFPFPGNTPIRVLVKIPGGEWTEVKPEAQWTPSERFVYAFKDNQLLVLANDETGSIDIRVSF